MIRGTAELGRKLVRPILTIGNFDGVHRGHHAILDIVMARARALDGEAVLYTCDPHPRKVLQPERAPLLLATLAQRREVLKPFGRDAVIVEPFDRAFATTPPDRFVREYIHRRIGPVEVYVGYDFHFGRDREGSMRLLTETGPRLGFSVTIVPEVTVAGRDVNSTRIRELISLGEMEEATLLLGRPFGVRGKVVEGEGRGQAVTNWGDSSKYGYDFTTSGSVDTPLFSSDSVYSPALPAVSFSSNYTNCLYQSQLDLNEEFTLFNIVRGSQTTESKIGR